MLPRGLTHPDPTPDVLVAIDAWIEGGPWPEGVRLRGEPSEEVLRAVLRSARARDVPREARCDVATLPLPSKMLIELARDTDEVVRWSVAANPATPSHTLTTFVNDVPAVRLRLAGNPSTSRTTLDFLADDEEAAVRARVARNPRTPEEALAELAQDGRIAVRRATATNASTPPAVRGVLANDADSGVRIRLAIHPSTRPDLLATLARDPDINVRRHVAANPTTASGVRAALLSEAPRPALSPAELVRALRNALMDLAPPNRRAEIEAGHDQLAVALADRDLAACPFFLRVGTPGKRFPSFLRRALPGPQDWLFVMGAEYWISGEAVVMQTSSSGYTLTTLAVIRQARGRPFDGVLLPMSSYGLLAGDAYAVDANDLPRCALVTCCDALPHFRACAEALPPQARTRPLGVTGTVHAPWHLGFTQLLDQVPDDIRHALADVQRHVRRWETIAGLPFDSVFLTGATPEPEFRPYFMAHVFDALRHPGVHSPWDAGNE